MPSYGTHALHGQLVLAEASPVIEIDPALMATCCFGPDALMTTSFKTFNIQHRYKVNAYFEALINRIKREKLADNKEAMAFLYGHLDHYILDATTHPLINYMTKGLPPAYKMDWHGLLELWIDAYMRQAYGQLQWNFLHMEHFKDKRVRELIDAVYSEVYDLKNASSKYVTGMNLLVILDRYIRTLPGIGAVSDALKIGNISLKETSAALQFMNENRQEWQNPVTGEVSNASFSDLFKLAKTRALETFEAVDNTIYKDKPLSGHYLVNDISYNTGLPCCYPEEETYPYVRKIGA